MPLTVLEARVPAGAHASGSYITRPNYVGSLPLTIGAQPSGRLSPAYIVRRASYPPVTRDACRRRLGRFGSTGVAHCRIPLGWSHYLNIFRGKPAIRRFDWPFTPSPKSSEPFATGTGAALPYVQPAQGKITAFRVFRTGLRGPPPARRRGPGSYRNRTPEHPPEGTARGVGRPPSLRLRPTP